MKKLFLIGAIAFAGLVSAQTSFGLKGGYTQSVVDITSEDVTVSSDGKSSFYVGGLIEHRFPNNLALQGELLYSPLGGSISQTYSEAGLSYSYKSDMTLNTLQVPVALKYYVTNGLALAGGLNLGFIVSSNEEYTSTVTFNGQTITGSGDDEIEDLNKLNLAPFVGAEYNLTNKLFFDARYNFGVSNLYGGDEDAEVKMNFFQIGLGFKF